MKHKSKKPKIDFDTPPPTTSVKTAETVRVTESIQHNESIEATGAIETTESTTVSEVYVSKQVGGPEEVGAHEQTDEQKPVGEQESVQEQESGHETEQERVKIDFPFSYLVRDRVPKVFDVAETAATQWKNNSKFENLGVEHPVAEIALVKVLEKAKEVERKLEEKGIISAAKMGIQVAKFQAEEILKKIKK